MDIISTEELRRKEIINLCDGTRLGYACDFEFNKCTAEIVGLIVEKNAGVGMKVADMTEDMVDVLETILVKLQEKAEELGI